MDLACSRRFLSLGKKRKIFSSLAISGNLNCPHKTSQGKDFGNYLVPERTALFFGGLPELKVVYF